MPFADARKRLVLIPKAAGFGKCGKVLRFHGGFSP